jgi:peptidyl-prolyl cis-trans isomerase A (cyclophilin A)
MKFPRALLLGFPLCFALLCGAPATRGGTLVSLNTPVGPLVAELYDADKPITTQNFLLYVNGGYYSNSIMHRLVPGFVVQGGGFYVQHYGTKTQELAYVPNYPPITNEFSTGPIYSNTFGTIAMAKTSDPNSATSQFFINLGDNSATLDNITNSGGFTVFGHVISGLATLTNFNNFAPASATHTNDVIEDLSADLTPDFATTPLLRPFATYSNFVFVATKAFSAPQLAISPQPGGGAKLSWNSNSNLVYHVDRGASLPSAWQEIASVQGAGTNLVYLDTVNTNAAAYYRIRLPY